MGSYSHILEFEIGMPFVMFSLAILFLSNHSNIKFYKICSNMINMAQCEIECKSGGHSDIKKVFDHFCKHRRQNLDYIKMKIFINNIFSCKH